MKASVKPTFFLPSAGQYKARIKDLKRKKFKLKAKLYLTIILPAFLMVLFTKALKAYLAIKVRALFTKAELAVSPAADQEAKEIRVEPVPVQRVPVQKIPAGTKTNKTPM